MRPERFGERGNIFLMLFGAVALAGTLGAVTMTTLRGPVAGAQKVTQHTTAQNEMTMNAAMLARLAVRRAGADCDSDGTIEPLGFVRGEAAFPPGGGLVPPSAGVSGRDPWGGLYGYCAWDHGTVQGHEECGGLLAGGDTQAAPVFAVISSGPDRVFQSSCADYADEETPLLIRGGDDIVRQTAYGQLFTPASSGAQLGELPDEACTAQTIGMMRLVAEATVQVCTNEGWTEVGSATQATASFEDVVNAPLGQEYTSNAISYAGFFGEKEIVVEGAAGLLINGQPAELPAKIMAGDDIALVAHAPGAPEQTATYSVSVNGVRKTWTITSRIDSRPA